MLKRIDRPEQLATEGVQFLRQIHEEVGARHTLTIQKAGENRFPGHVEA